MIRIEHLTRRFQDLVAVDDISLHVREGEVLSLTDGARTVGEIAEALRGTNPQLSLEQAEREVVTALRGRVETSIPHKV